MVEGVSRSADVGIYRQGRGEETSEMIVQQLSQRRRARWRAWVKFGPSWIAMPDELDK